MFNIIASPCVWTFIAYSIEQLISLLKAWAMWRRRFLRNKMSNWFRCRIHVQFEEGDSYEIWYTHSVIFYLWNSCIVESGRYIKGTYSFKTQFVKISSHNKAPYGTVFREMDFGSGNLSTSNFGKTLRIRSRNRSLIPLSYSLMFQTFLCF